MKISPGELIPEAAIASDVFFQGDLVFDPGRKKSIPSRILSMHNIVYMYHFTIPGKIATSQFFFEQFQNSFSSNFKVLQYKPPFLHVSTEKTLASIA